MKSGKWKTFERLVALIEKSLAPHHNVEVKHDIRIKDNSGILRQVDVLIKYNIEPRFDLKVIIECKDHKRKISLDYIEC